MIFSCWKPGGYAVLAGLALWLAGCHGGPARHAHSPHDGSRIADRWPNQISSQDGVIEGPAAGRSKAAAGRGPEIVPASAESIPEVEEIEETSDARVQPLDESPLVAVDFPTALMVATGQNPQVAFAHARIEEAFAQLDGAEVLWLPSINGGINYNKHEGTIQDVEGEIVKTSRGALYSGLGARAVGAGSPAVPGVFASFHLRDAVFQPRIADRVTAARQQAATAVTNDVLLDVALAYLELLRAFEQQAISEETAGNAEQLSDLTDTFARTGQIPQADADRARTELAIRQNELRRAEEATRVASARLVQLLSQDPSLRLVPEEPTVVPIELVARDLPIRELVATGLSNRPELGETQALVQEAVERLRREAYAPLIPSVLLGVSQGGFGAGLGGDIANFGGRLDIDVAAFWEVRNLGLGERAARNEARARVSQARFRDVQTMDLVAREVTEAHAQVQARFQQILTAENGVRFALDSHRRNWQRIRETQGLPLEALQSIQALDQARRDYLRSVIDYNEAQFRLQRALGWPISPLRLFGERGGK